MIAEFSVIPIGKGESLSDAVAECIKIVKEKGIKYQLTATSTILEGEYHQVMDVIDACHHRVLDMTPRVLTSIRIDDRVGEQSSIEGRVSSVERKVAGPIVR